MCGFASARPALIGRGGQQRGIYRLECPERSRISTKCIVAIADRFAMLVSASTGCS